jgi:hypothetical protein
MIWLYHNQSECFFMRGNAVQLVTKKAVLWPDDVCAETCTRQGYCFTNVMWVVHDIKYKLLKLNRGFV